MNYLKGSSLKKPVRERKKNAKEKCNLKKWEWTEIANGSLISESHKKTSLGTWELRQSLTTLQT